MDKHAHIWVKAPTHTVTFMMPLCNCVCWSWSIAVKMVPAHQMAFNLGVCHVVFKMRHILADSASNHTSLTCSLGTKGREQPLFLLGEGSHHPQGIALPIHKIKPSSIYPAYCGKTSSDQCLREVGVHSDSCSEIEVQLPMFRQLHRLLLTYCTYFNNAKKRL